MPVPSGNFETLNLFESRGGDLGAPIGGVELTEISELRRGTIVVQRTWRSRGLIGVDHGTWNWGSLPLLDITTKIPRLKIDMRFDGNLISGSVFNWDRWGWVIGMAPKEPWFIFGDDIHGNYNSKTAVETVRFIGIPVSSKN